MDKDLELDGKLVYLTRYQEKWFKDLDAKFDVPITNRLAKVVKVFDWETEEGKILLAEREKTGKWARLDPKAFKFVLKVYYPELVFKNSKRVMLEEVTSRYYPGTTHEMFSLIPDWMLKDIVKEEKNTFKVELKGKKD
jgi:hypothetical protein